MIITEDEIGWNTNEDKDGVKDDDEEEDDICY